MLNAGAVDPLVDCFSHSLWFLVFFDKHIFQWERFAKRPRRDKSHSDGSDHLTSVEMPSLALLTRLLSYSAICIMYPSLCCISVDQSVHLVSVD